jgi:hypothetical protein
MLSIGMGDDAQDMGLTIDLNPSLGETFAIHPKYFNKL